MNNILGFMSGIWYFSPDHSLPPQKFLSGVLLIKYVTLVIFFF